MFCSHLLASGQNYVPTIFKYCKKTMAVMLIIIGNMLIYKLESHSNRV